ncbi:DNA-binding MarR family transcriptional regulator [Scopulibacillus darangshiensis]|uniref:DNA-binding MarR family transcriptional regulator n=1 Tax=Scopulibacillus darangshiensis TaxID=442528 RepID=A0A4R2P8C6_9BACL|nr:MarR family transcriptional regulator [Scopulibacillus darangshiensis]TCP30558.1 DNA-binding MarR family transcriptional regulator [Scopulibacillus darangshiensis]
MDNKITEKLVERYERVQFAVHKKAQLLMRGEIGEELTTEQHATLRHIKHFGPSTSTQLAEAFLVKKSAITAIINRLIDKKMITRRRDQNDRRVIYLSLTDYGEEIYKQCEDKIHALVGSFITQFEPKEIELFLNTFEKLEKILDKQILDMSEGAEK